MAIKTGRKKPPREVVVSASKLQSLAFDNPGSVIELTPTHGFLALDGVVYVAVVAPGRAA